MRCESCKKPIQDNEKFVRTEDDYYLCKKCATEFKKENEKLKKKEKRNESKS